MRVLIAIAALLVTGCEKADNAPGPGGVTVGEARALDEAAQMIEARRPPADLMAPPANGTLPASGTPAQATATDAP